MVSVCSGNYNFLKRGKTQFFAIAKAKWISNEKETLNLMVIRDFFRGGNSQRAFYDAQRA